VVDKKTAKKLKLGKTATVVGTVTRSVGGSVKLKIKLAARPGRRCRSRAP
jgi:hypothetical protein